jgi:single-strand DNA-binding protein
MGYSVNKVFLLGHVGKDPEVRAIPSGTKVANFSLATDESYKDKAGQKVQKTEWHNLVAWSGLAEICEKFVKKGSKLHIDGHLQTRSWDDQEGKKRYMTEIVVDNLVLLGDKGGAQGSAAARPAERPASEPTPGQSQGAASGYNPDDLPF